MIDNGFKKLFDMSFSYDYSKLYENQVFLHLRRYTDEIYYFKQKQEVDFYAKTTTELLVNVSYDISNLETYKREVDALKDGGYNLKQSYLITSERDEEVKVDNNKTVHIIPLWKWMLEDLE